MEIAFEPGGDPALLLANHGISSGSLLKGTSESLLATSEVSEESLAWIDSVRREEQAVIDSIIHGKEHGHYFLIMGPKASMYRILAFINPLMPMLPRE